MKQSEKDLARYGVPLALLALFLLVRVFAPYAIWQGNDAELKFSFAALLPYLIDIPLLLSLAFASVLLWFAPVPLQRFAHALIAAAFAIAFIEFSFFQGEMALIGETAGGVVADTSERWLPLLVYSAILVAFLTLRRHLVGWTSLILVAFLVTQTATIVIGSRSPERRARAVAADVAATDAPGLGIDLDAISTFSSSENIVHIVLDELQSSFFIDVLDRKFPRARRQLDGFTFYRDHLGLYPDTRGGVGYFFAGEIWKNDIDLESWRQRGLSGTMFHDVLDAGFRVDLVSFPPYSPLRSGDGLQIAAIPVPFVDQGEHSVAREKRAEASLVLDVALMRTIPDRLKAELAGRWPSSAPGGAPGGGVSKFHQYPRQRLASNVAFLETLIRQARVGDDTKRYKLLHFVTTHGPASLDADCSLSRNVRPPSFEAFVPQAECGIGQLLRFLAKLRELGIYDAATIVVHADHGARLAVDGDRHLEEHFYGGVQTPKIYPYLMSQVICSGLPLLMIKPSGAHGELRSSTAPVWYGDIPATIRSVAGIMPRPGEHSILDVAADEKRKRHFYYYHYGRRLLTDHDRMIKYEVDGPSWIPTSWRKAEEYVSVKRDYEKALIDMGKAEDRYFERDGWMAGVTTGKRTVAFTMGRSATLALELGERRPRKLTVHMSSPLAGQEVETLLAGRELGSVRLTDQEFRSYEFAIPREVTETQVGLVDLEFRPRKVQRQWPPDGRRLEVGVAVDWIRLE